MPPLSDKPTATQSAPGGLVTATVHSRDLVSDVHCKSLQPRPSMWALLSRRNLSYRGAAEAVAQSKEKATKIERNMVIGLEFGALRSTADFVRLARNDVQVPVKLLEKVSTVKSTCAWSLNHRTSVSTGEFTSISILNQSYLQ